MTEKALKDYFDCKISVFDLAIDLKDSEVKSGSLSTSIRIDNIDESGEYQVAKQHLIKLSNDTLSGFLTMNDLNIIAFGLIASDYFNWDNETKDGEIVATTLFDWDNPDINYPLNVDNLKLWKEYLKTSDYKLNNKK